MDPEKGVSETIIQIDIGQKFITKLWAKNLITNQKSYKYKQTRFCLTDSTHLGGNDF